MSEASIIAIVCSLLGVSGGTLLGSLLTRRNEKRRWRRERCLEAYSDIFTLCDIFLQEADKAYSMECGSSEQAKQNLFVYEKAQELYRAGDKVTLVGSTDVYNKVQELTLYCGKIIGTKSTKCPKPSESDWRQIRITDFVGIFKDLREYCREDL